MLSETNYWRPKVSVLLPAYNAQSYVREAIVSILGQTYSDFELLVADDASLDGTREVIDSIEDPRIRRFHNDRNLGKTATVAKLYLFAVGELITIHDADDSSFYDRFERQVEEFRRNPELAMCGTSFISVAEDGESVIEKVVMPETYEKVLAAIDSASQFHGPTMMIRASVLKELGEVYRPYFRNNYEDTDLAYRIVERFPAYNLQDVLYRYRILPDSLCRKNVDVRNRNLYKVVVFLAEERRMSGLDSIQRGLPEEADKYFDKVTRQYKYDTSLVHREAAGYFMNWRFHRRAIGECLVAVIKNPLRLINLRTLVYCVRTAAAVETYSLLRSVFLAVRSKLKFIIFAGCDFIVRCAEQRRSEEKYKKYGIDSSCRVEGIEVVGNVVIGKHSYINTGSAISTGDKSRVFIGKYCAIGRHVTITSKSHAFEAPTADDDLEFPRHTEANVHIGDYVWIGDKVFVRQGVRVGDYAIIGANSVVTRDVSDFEVVAGVPARHIRFNTEHRKYPR